MTRFWLNGKAMARNPTCASPSRKNPELARYREVNVGNPDSSIMVQQDLPPLIEEEQELWLVKHAVFDELRFRHTPENDAGVFRRVEVKVPFTKKAFSTFFEKGTFLLANERKLDFSEIRNVRSSCTAVEIASVFGSETFTRQSTTIIAHVHAVHIL